MNILISTLKRACLLPLVYFLLLYEASAQNSMGIGTNTPNQNAVLELVSPGNNQGFLVPRLTTAQRTTLAGSLAPGDVGLMLFDSDNGNFYFWDGSGWMVMSGGPVVVNTDGTTINGDGDGVPLSVNTGTGPNQIVQLDGGGALPAVDGSALTGVPAVIGPGAVTETELNVSVAGAGLNGGGGTPLAVDAGTGPNQIVQLDGGGALPALDGSALTGVPAVIGAGAVTETELNVSVAGVGLNGGGGTPLAVDAGTGPNQIVQLDGGGALPALDGSALTGVPAVIGPGAVTETELNVSVAGVGLNGGGGSPLAVDAGTGPNQIVQLDGGGALPALDGSALTGVPAVIGPGAVTETELNVSVAGAGLNGGGGTPLAVDAGTGPNQIVQLDGGGALPALDGSALTGVPAVIGPGAVTETELNVSVAGVGLNGGGGTPLAVDAGTGPNQIVQLDGGGALPALDGSALTGVPAVIGPGAVTETELNVSVAGAGLNGGGGTPLAVDAGTAPNQIVQLDGGGALPAVDGSGLSGLTSGQIGGLGTAATLNVGTAANEVVQLDGSARLPAVDASQLTNLPGGLVTQPGTNNLVAGTGAGSSLSSGTGNTIFGESAGTTISTEGSNTIYGTFAGQNATNSFNTLIGYQAGLNNTGPNTTSVGNGAGPANTGVANSFVGSRAGQSNTSGASNSFFGFSAGRDNTTSSFNTYVGYASGIVATGAENTMVGQFSGGATTTGIRNNFFGRNTAPTNVTGSDLIVIGNDADVSIDGLTNAVAIGNTSTVGANFATAIGDAADGAGARSVALGNIAVASNSDAIAIGHNAVASADGAIALGDNITAAQANTVILGNTFDGYTVGIGTATPAVSLDIAATDAIRIPVGTTLQQPGTPADGMIRYNSDNNQFEGYGLASWSPFASSAADIFSIPVADNATAIAFGSSTVIGAPSGAAIESIENAVDAGGAIVAAATFSTDPNNNRTALAMVSSRGNQGTPSPLLNGDLLGEIVFNGAVGGVDVFENGATIEAYASQNYNGTSSGGELVFSTTLNNTLTAVERMRITTFGEVAIGAPAVPSAELHVFSQNTGTSAAVMLAEDNAAATLFEVDANGNTGVGISAPAAFLQVRDNGGVTHPQGLFVVENNAGTDYVTVNNAGNVGIRNNAPSTELDVSGTVTATAFVGDGSGLTGVSGSSIFTEDVDNNLYGGGTAGGAIVSTSGLRNTLVGVDAGSAVTTGDDNVFLGHQAGNLTTTGGFNTFIGRTAGFNNIDAGLSVFVGFRAGFSTTSDNSNTFIGANSGENTDGGNLNTFVGERSGQVNTTGQGNTFIGRLSGVTNTTGFFNTLLGKDADLGAPGLSRATAIGHGAIVSQNNSLVLGGTGADAVNVGIGTATPSTVLEVVGDVGIPETNAYTYLNPKTHFESYTGDSFHPWFPDVTDFRASSTIDNYRYFSAGAGQQLAAAPIHLPDNAIITDLNGWLFDGDAGLDVQLQIISQPLGSSTYSIVTTIGTTGSPSVVENLSNTGIGEMIDNQNNSYYLLYTAPGGNTETRLYGALISYTVTQVD